MAGTLDSRKAMPFRLGPNLSTDGDFGKIGKVACLNAHSGSEDVAFVG